MKEKEILSGLDSLFGELSSEWFRSKYPDESRALSRWQVFTAPVVAFLFIVQKLDSRNSIAAALSYLKASVVGSGIDKLLGGSRRVAARDISSSTGGLSQAKERLPLELVRELFVEINTRLARLNKSAKVSEEARNRSKWFLLDGSTISLQNTKEIRKQFPALNNQYGGCQPYCRVVFGHNLFGAVAEYPEIGKMTDSEQFLAKNMMRSLPPGSGIVADRNFGVFSMVFSARENKLGVLVRMTRARAASLIGNKLNQDGIYDVAWTCTKRDRDSNPEIPEGACVKGTIIVVTIPAKRNEKFFFFASEQLTAQQAADIYKQRWCIENDIRTLKHTVNLDTIYAKTPAMIEKEILLGIVAYNMVRALIVKGASRLNLSPRDISFSRATEIIFTTAVHLSCAKTPLEADIAIQQFYKSLYQVKHPKRTKPRVEPHAIVAHERSKFGALKGTRQEARDKILNNLAQ